MTTRYLVWLCLLLVWSCAGDRSNIELSSAEIELDAFSGRPNPRWQLHDAELAALERRLRRVPATPRSEVLAQGLGYRGFYIHDGEVRIQVTNGLLAVSRDDGDAEVYRDVHDVEDFLIKQAVQRGYGDIISGN